MGRERDIIALFCPDNLIIFFKASILEQQGKCQIQGGFRYPYSLKYLGIFNAPLPRQLHTTISTAV